jgi:hypothetical protein
MKRREFLAQSSVGVAGALLPALLRAEPKPCPPPTLSVGSGTVTSTCVAEATGPAPAWFGSQAVRSWKTVAGSATVKACMYSPFLTVSGNYGNSDFFDDYSGATVDQARREMLMVADGGHADYLGNEGYALALWAESPYWYRLNGPTPASSTYYPGTSGTAPAVNRDGRSPSMHTYGLQVHANGRVWYTHQGHVSSGAGSWTNGVVAFNREFPGLPTSNAQPPLAWENNPGPWEKYGAMNNSPHGLAGAASNQWSGATSVYDPNSECIYTVCPESPGFDYVKLNTRTGAHNCYSQNSFGSPPPYVGNRCAPVVVDDRSLLSSKSGVLVVMHENSNVIHLASIPKMGLSGQGTIWISKTPGGNAPVPRKRGASVYHNGAIYYMDWSSYGSTIYKLTLPADLQNGDWSNAWSVEASHGSNPAAIQSLMPVGAYGGAGQWSKFNIVRDMGDGHAALVCAAAHSGPVAVYKIA